MPRLVVTDGSRPFAGSGDAAGAKPLIERLFRDMAAASPATPASAVGSAAADTAGRQLPAAPACVGPRRGMRRHHRKALFGCVMVNGLAYEAPELDAMLILEPLLVWTDPADLSQVVVSTSDTGPFFVARCVSGLEPLA